MAINQSNLLANECLDVDIFIEEVLDDYGIVVHNPIDHTLFHFIFVQPHKFLSSHNQLNLPMESNPTFLLIIVDIVFIANDFASFQPIHLLLQTHYPKNVILFFPSFFEIID